MHPIAFYFGSLPVRWYGVMMAGAFLAGLWTATRRARLANISGDVIADVTLWLMLGSIIGARIVYVTTYWKQEFAGQPFREVFMIQHGGLVYYGGLIGATISGLGYLAWKKLPVWKIADILAPSIALGSVFGRIGCLLNGCCYGRACDLPWAIHFPLDHETHGAAVHPTEIYDALLNLILYVFLAWLFRRKKFDGQIFATLSDHLRRLPLHRGIFSRRLSRRPCSCRTHFRATRQRADFCRGNNPGIISFAPRRRQMKPPIFIAGPTAVGKSEIALTLAEKNDGEIISVDSMQVYRGLDLGTAKPTAVERKKIPHHLIDICDLHEAFDAAQFIRRAQKAVAEIQSRNKTPIFCGGTGLYFKAFLEGLGEAPATDSKMRAELEAASFESLLRELRERDPAAYEKIDKQNPRRVIRAMEVIRPDW